MYVFIYIIHMNMRACANVNSTLLYGPFWSCSLGVVSRTCEHSFTCQFHTKMLLPV